MTMPAAPVPAIHVANLHKFYGHHHVLHDVSLDVAEGETVVLVGPSGSGKSTLLRCLNQLESIAAGRIEIHGVLAGYREVGGVLHDLTPKEKAVQRRQTGMVFQNFNLFGHMTALQNIIEAPVRVARLPRHEAVRDGEELLARVGMADKANSYPAQLSGGQQQRVAIARALAMRPRIMLFDEPTSALDPELVGEVLDVMSGLAEQGMTMVVVTHEMEFARDIAHRIVVMADGRIIEEGDPRQVLRSPRTERASAFFSRLNRDRTGAPDNSRAQETSS